MPNFVIALFPSGRAPGTRPRSGARARALVSGLIFLSVLGALSACGGSSEERKIKHFERAMALYEQGNTVKARLEFKNVLQIDAKHAASHYMLGRISEEHQNFETAYRHFSRAVHFDPGHLLAKLRLGSIYLLGNQVESALEMAQKALEQDPQNVDALVLRGKIRAHEKDFERAMSDGRAALELDRSHTEAISLVARLLIHGHQNDEAITLIEDGVARNPRDTDLRMLVAQLKFEQGDVEGAAEIFKKVVSLEPDVLEHRVRLAALYISLSAPDQAEEVLRAGVARDPEDASSELALVSFLKDQRGSDVAEAELLKFIDENPGQHELKFALAELYVLATKHEMAGQAYLEIIDAVGDGPQADMARVGLARNLMYLQRLEDAQALIAQVLKTNPKYSDALVLGGMIALEKGDADTAIANFRTVLQDASRSAEVLRLLASAHLRNDRRHSAMDALKRAAEVDPSNVLVRLQLAQLLFEAGQGAEAGEQYGVILELSPDHEYALEGLARIQITERDFGGAGKKVSRAKSAYPDAAWPHYYAGVIALLQGEYSTSIVDLETALARVPEDPKVLLALVSSYVSSGQESRAISTLNDTLVKSPQNLAARMMLGQLLSQHGKQQEADREFEEAINANPGSEQPYRLLALYRLGRGEVDKSLELYERGLAATGGSFGFLMELGVAYERAGKSERAISTFEQALVKDPESRAAANNLALMLATYRQDQASLDRAKMLAERLQDGQNVLFMDTLGWVHLKRGEVEIAIPLLERALSTIPDSPEILYHLGVAYEAKGDRKAARAHLERALAPNAFFPGIEEARGRLDALDGG